jgi:hypothetical protein
LFHSFGQQLFTTSLLFREGGKATLLRSKGAEDLFDTRTVFDRLFHLGFSTCTSSFMTGGAGELFNQRATLLCFQAQRLVNGALTDEEKAIFGEARTIEQLIEIAKANLFAIEQILLAAATIGAAGDLNLREWQIKEPIVIRNGERYLGKTEWTALL